MLLAFSASLRETSDDICPSAVTVAGSDEVSHPVVLIPLCCQI